jgi:hypothetical protein
VIAFGTDAITFGPELVTLFHSSIALMERPSQERDPAVKLKWNHTDARSSHNLGDRQCLSKAPVAVLSALSVSQRGQPTEAGVARRRLG